MHKNHSFNFGTTVEDDRKVLQNGVKGGAEHPEPVEYVLSRNLNVHKNLDRAQDKEGTILQHARVSKVWARSQHAAPYLGGFQWEY